MSRLQMDENTFLSFYRTTALGYSKPMQAQICEYMEKNHIITHEQQQTLGDTPDTKFFPASEDTKNILSSIANERADAYVFEYLEFVKLYKYSVPFFYEGDAIAQISTQTSITLFDEKEYHPTDFSIALTIPDAQISKMMMGNDILLKIVLQKNYINPETKEAVDYRYPIVLFFDTDHKIVEIRYDSLKYSTPSEHEFYEKSVTDIVNWLLGVLKLHLFICDFSSLIEHIRSDTSGKVKIYKQMMQLSSGGAAELTASEDEDYILPFIGELRELIDENAELFDADPAIRDLILKYLDDNEITAAYPYIYVKWLDAVDSKSYIVKFTFNYFCGTYTLLQHLTGICKNLRMERMNNVIKYLCESSSFTKGEEICQP